MDFQTYMELAQRTSDDRHDKSVAGVLGLIGETGEVVDVVKKYLIQSGENPVMDREKLIKEVGDVCWYVAEYISGLRPIAETAVPAINNTIHSEERWEGVTEADLPATEDGKRSTPEWILFQKIVFEHCRALAQTVANADIAPQHCEIEMMSAMINHLKHLLYLFNAGTIEEAMVLNIEKLKKRYPDGFSAARSLHRERDDT